MIRKIPASCDDNDVNMLAALHECLRSVVVINGPVVHPKNFKRLCMGGQSTPMFSIKYSRQLVVDCYKSFTVLYSNSS